MDCGAISSDFERKILWHRQFFENYFGRKSAKNRTQSHTPQHADVQQSCWGPLRVVSMLRTTERHEFRRDLKRFRTKILRPRKFFENFDRESHAISHAAACRRSAELLGTSEGREHAAHNRAAWISARSHAISNAKFCCREKFSKFSVRNPV